MSNIHTATGGYKFRTINRKTSYLHIDAAERALGKKLPPGAEVHHANGDPSDNRPSNLVICPDHKYHALLHMRTEAIEITGNADLRLCCVCQTYGHPSHMRSSGRRVYHAKCMAFRSKQLRKRALLTGDQK